MQYNSLKRKRESAFSPNPKKKQIFLPPKQPSRAPVSSRSSRKPLSCPRRPSGFAAETQVKNSPRHQNEKNPENWQLVLDKCKTAGIITNVRQANIAGLCNGSTADSDSECEGSNPSPAATEKSETVRFWTSFFLFDPLSDPLTVLQLLSTDGVLHIGFHSICTVLLHLLRNMTVYVQSECRGRVTKIGLHCFYIITILKTQDRVSVTQTVNIGLFRSDLLCNFLEVSIYRLRAVMIAKYRCEDEPSFLFFRRAPSTPRKVGFHTLLYLLFFLIFQHIHQHRWWCQQALFIIF